MTFIRAKPEDYFRSDTKSEAATFALVDSPPTPTMITIDGNVLVFAGIIVIGFLAFLAYLFSERK